MVLSSGNHELNILQQSLLFWELTKNYLTGNQISLANSYYEADLYICSPINKPQQILVLWNNSVSEFLWICGLRKCSSLWVPLKAIWFAINLALKVLQFSNVHKSKYLWELSLQKSKFFEPSLILVSCRRGQITYSFCPNLNNKSLFAFYESQTHIFEGIKFCIRLKYSILFFLIFQIWNKSPDFAKSTEF